MPLAHSPQLLSLPTPSSPPSQKNWALLLLIGPNSHSRNKIHNPSNRPDRLDRLDGPDRTGTTDPTWPDPIDTIYLQRKSSEFCSVRVSRNSTLQCPKCRRKPTSDFSIIIFDDQFTTNRSPPPSLLHHHEDALRRPSSTHPTPTSTSMTSMVTSPSAP